MRLKLCEFRKSAEAASESQEIDTQVQQSDRQYGPICLSRSSEHVEYDVLTEFGPVRLDLAGLNIEIVTFYSNDL